MRKLILIAMIAVFSTLLLVGCSNQKNEEVKKVTDNDSEAREAAWNFIQEKRWNNNAKGNWQSANVINVIANNNYELLDKTFEGKEVLSVSFEDKENRVIGTPLILIDKDSNKVIGYMPSE
jgi:uncharacterized lipoprotein NlpE involved in copper resistance